MKKFGMALVLAAVSGAATAAVGGAAMAEWVAIFANGGTTTYADAASIRRSGDMVKAWALWDHKSPKSIPGIAPFLSTKTQYEFDCKGERYRTLYSTSHSKKLSTGEVVFTDSEPADWRPVPAGSNVGATQSFACRKS